ncbi:MAG: HlyD family efflux transporter periplasmic adaptor subunit, partial [Planctomycetota bacterium]
RAGLAVAVATAVSAGALTTYWIVQPSEALAVVDADHRLHTVQNIDLDVTVKQDGELEAVRNIEIRNAVQGNRTITFLVSEGARVAEGDVLAILDAGDLEAEIDRLEVEEAERITGLESAKEQLEWQRTQNAADLESAQVSASLAEMDLKRYEEGTWPQKLSDASAKVEAAEVKLRGKRQDLQASIALFAKGFVTGKKVADDREEVKKVEGELDRARQALEVLRDYEHPMELKRRQNKVRTESNNTLRVQSRGQRSLTHRQNDVSRSESRLKRVQDLLEWKRSQYDDCTIKAPSAGLVVYHNDGRNQIAEGETVHHRQTLIKLPDTDQMKAVVRVPENRVSLLETGMIATVDKPVDGFNPLEASVNKISVLAESTGRWFDRDTREYPVDLLLAQTPEGLKPGLKIQATVFVDRLRDVLAVPVSCLYKQGETSFVFVRTDEGAGIEPRAIELGKANETHTEVVSGLSPGERILELQVGEGRRLLEQFGLLNETEAAPTAVPTPVASVAE